MEKYRITLTTEERVELERLVSRGRRGRSQILPCTYSSVGR